MPVVEKVLHIDIPVTLDEVKVVFSIASLSFGRSVRRCLSP
jgi:hypothetical protein